jgi:hypothetical protein
MLSIAAPPISPWCNTRRIEGRGQNKNVRRRSKMKIAGGLAVAALFAGVAVGVASPASAEEFLGTYTMSLGEGADSSTWTVTPCASDPEQKGFIPCVHVADSGNSSNAPWQADAHLSVGYWDLAVERPDAVSCDDGTKLPARVKYWWNAATLEGVLGFYFPGGCGDAQAGSLSGPFTLTRNGPPPAID